MCRDFGNTTAELDFDIATGGSHRFERVEQGTYAVIRTVRRAGRLPGRASGGNCRRIRRLPRRGMRSERSFHRRAGRYVARGPRAQNLESLRRSSVLAVARKHRKHAPGTIGRPPGQRRVAFAGKRSAAMNRHETPVPTAHRHSCLG